YESRMENEQKSPFPGKESILDVEKRPSEMLKDLVLQWFLTTQVPLIVQDGSLPEWFHGFITRTQAEELLKDRDLGCFLIRLNERSFGYILSYRHQRNGYYAISGDTQTHPSLAELISYYQRTEIEPFGEKLSVACSKQEETSVYDKISVDQQTSSKQSSTAGAPMLTRQDSDDAPPVPARSSLLLSESFEDNLSGEGNIFYAELKKHQFNDRSPEVPEKPYKGMTDGSQRPEGADQGTASSCRKKTTTLFTMAKQSDRFYSQKIDLRETVLPETIYSEIDLDQDKSGWMLPEPLTGQFSLTPPKKVTLSSPSSTPPKLSPKNKPNTSMEPQGSTPPFAACATSLVIDKDSPKPKTLPDSPRETMYGQINKVKSHYATVSTCDKTSNMYEQVSFGWLKGVTHEHDSEKLSKALPTKPKQSYDWVSPRSGRPSKMQPCPDDPYRKVPDHFTKVSPSIKHVPTMENTYEQIPFSPAKGTEAKPSHKVSASLLSLRKLK
ncbi:hypothetical protein JD844_014160, partial [Phrynosoma platyrhinos]